MRSPPARRRPDGVPRRLRRDPRGRRARAQRHDYSTGSTPSLSDDAMKLELLAAARAADPGCGCPECGDGCGDDALLRRRSRMRRHVRRRVLRVPAARRRRPPRSPSPCATSHKGLFYANDFSYLKDPCYNGCCLGDCMKLMPVGPCGRWGTLDIGGQVRLRYHDEEGMGRRAGIGRLPEHRERPSCCRVSACTATGR